MPSCHLAIDLGASSGRAILGVVDADLQTVQLEEVHRFEHHPCPTPAGPIWDLTGIWLNILTGMRKAKDWCVEQEVELDSVGVDTWGVDWCLVGKSGELLAMPHCYRDPQNELALERVLKQVGGKAALYERNGIQLMAINSIFQVAARLECEPQLFEAAHRLLFVPDLFHFWLSGEMTTERTIASTSGMLAVDSGQWDVGLMRELGIPTDLLGPIIEPGTVIGSLREEVAEAVGLTDSLARQIKIIAPGAHDTAAAITAVPVANGQKKWAYLSSGTWSLLGAELPEPVVSPESCAAPFTNERGINQTIRFLKNIGGLWLVQELRRELEEKGESISFQELADQARNADPFRTLINPNESRFGAPGDMANKIRSFAEETNQPVPETIGDLVRCCLESLALSYRDTVDLLESILEQEIEVLHVVGGGTNNQLLNELTAAAMERPVVCGPVEATAIGNLLTQAMGCGEILSLDQLRATVGNSFELQHFDKAVDSEPLQFSKDVFKRYQSLLGK